VRACGAGPAFPPAAVMGVMFVTGADQ
jgi:hypothetical protein